jgi:Tol biopolymer transport system component
VTLTGVDDAIIDGDQAVAVVTSAAASTDPGYNGLDPVDVGGTNRDDDALPERLSVDSAGAQGGALSQYPAVSADGRWAVFASNATNLVAGDTNGATDVFLRDRSTGTTTRLSVDSAGAQANGASTWPVISADGHYVAFFSAATNLVAGDTNGAQDVFVRDTTTNATTRASVGPAGAQGNGASINPAISSDGRWVAFQSDASNLVTGDTNRVRDVFLHDRSTGATIRVSVDSAGAQGNGASSAAVVSADGRYVLFASDATNLVLRDTNLRTDVFLRDTSGGGTTRISVSSAGAEGNGASLPGGISADGRYVAFQSDATNLVSGDTNGTTDVLLRDRTAGATTRISIDTGGGNPNGASSAPTITEDGRYVAYQSAASDLVAGDTNGAADVFVRDRTGGTTVRASVDRAGAQVNGASSAARVAPRGRFVVFHSVATNLVAGDTNGVQDAFIAAVP